MNGQTAQKLIKDEETTTLRVKESCTQNSLGNGSK